MKLKIRNLQRFQHYRNRYPPWIKLHREILDNPGYCRLGDSAWRLGLELLLVTSESENGHLETTPEELSWRLRRTVTHADLEELVKARFLEPLEGPPAHADTPEAPETAQPGPNYPEGFSAAWAAFPHRSGRSKKAESLKLWKKLKLEPVANTVLAWIAYATQTDDWTKDSGRYVPGFQVWIKGHDFTEPVPETGSSALEEWIRETH